MKLHAKGFIALLSSVALLAPLAGSGKEAVRDSSGDRQPLTIDIPIPVGHEAKELKFPYFDATRKLRMTFFISIAKRRDHEHVEMASALMETFDEGGRREMQVSLSASVLDLQTSIVSSGGPVTIRRADFELSGDAMEFNTRTRSGKLTGNIRMLIYDRNTMVEENGS